MTEQMTMPKNSLLMKAADCALCVAASQGSEHSHKGRVHLMHTRGFHLSSNDLTKDYLGENLIVSSPQCGRL